MNERVKIRSGVWTPIIWSFALFASVLSGCTTRFAEIDSAQEGREPSGEIQHCKDVFPRECEEKVNLFIRFEQTRNIKDIYKDGVFQNDLPAEYQASSQRSFSLPYFILELETEWLQTADIGTKPDFITKHHIIQDESGKKFFKFPVHPVAVEDYRTRLEGVPFTFVEEDKSEFVVTPTASERTLIRNLEATEPGGSYMIKVSLPLEINNRPRTLYPTEMKRGVWFSRQLSGHFASANDLLFFFREPFGAYPRGRSEVLGATVFREFPEEFYASGRRVVPLFSYLAQDESGQPLFARSMPPDGSTDEKWNWYKSRILEPFLTAIRRITYESGMGMQLHSQNLTVELTADLKQITGRFGYRDLGGAFYDLPGALVKGDELPSFDAIRDFQRELGLAYFKGHSFLDWTRFFLKNQVSDLFAIQMASHGIISRELRDLWKGAAWNLMVEDYRKTYTGQWRNRQPGLERVLRLPETHSAFSLYDEDEEPASLDHLVWWQKGDFYLGVDKEETRVFAIGLPLSVHQGERGELFEPFKLRLASQVARPSRSEL